jgi:hypothetical protein
MRFAGVHQREAHRLLASSAQLFASMVKGMFGDPALPANTPALEAYQVHLLSAYSDDVNVTVVISQAGCDAGAHAMPDAPE